MSRKGRAYLLYRVYHCRTRLQSLMYAKSKGMDQEGVPKRAVKESFDKAHQWKVALP